MSEKTPRCKLFIASFVTPKINKALRSGEGFLSFGAMEIGPAKVAANRVAALAMKRGKSVDFTGYWQRHITE
jgi:hypothetical protein